MNWIHIFFSFHTMLRYILPFFFGFIALVVATKEQSTSALLSSITTSFDSIKGVDALKLLLEKVKAEIKDESLKTELTVFLDSTLLESQRQTIRMNNLFDALFTFSSLLSCFSCFSSF